jgi:hypothetical protein
VLKFIIFRFCLFTPPPSRRLSKWKEKGKENSIFTVKKIYISVPSHSSIIDLNI